MSGSQNFSKWDVGNGSLLEEWRGIAPVGGSPEAEAKCYITVQIRMFSCIKIQDLIRDWQS